MNRLLVIFGKPGAGKSYVADILAKKFGFFVYDGDGDIPETMKKTLYERGPITDAMRREFLHNLIASISRLITTHEKLVINQAFIKHFMQKEFLDGFPQAQFILVTAAEGIREKRYMARDYFNLGLPYLRQMSSLFEEPEIPHITIVNNQDGRSGIEKQLQTFISGVL